MTARRRRITALLLVAGLALPACSGSDGATGARGTGSAGRPAKAPDAAAKPPGTTALKPVAKLRARVRPDVLVVAAKPLGDRTVAALRKKAPSYAAFSSGRARLAGHAVGIAGVDPSLFRKFTPRGTAEADGVWETVARGELVLAHDLAKARKIELGSTVMVRGKITLPLRVGAFATTGIPGTGALVSPDVAATLGLTATNAVLLGGGKREPSAVADAARRIVRKRATVNLLTKPEARLALLTGGSAASAFGGFTYKWHDDGTIEPDAAWVAANIRSESVPILGRITCHRLMLPQLRAALTEVQSAGLAHLIRSYDGCYVPRFIERDPSYPVSLHTWGVAIDLDAASNQRGGRGTMDERIVAIFKRWGFRWGGDWSYTDPMHFELGALITTPS